jgi:hypothetical protein
MKNLIIISIALVGVALLFSSCKPGISVECATKMRDVNAKDKNIGATFTVACPAKCAGATAWGTDTYTTDSSVCVAAIHAGVIPADKGGMVKVTVVKSIEKYKGSDRNGVKTADWPTAWGDTAFQVSK